MHKAARQQHLLKLLSAQGQADIAELASTLKVSDDTVRRDLAELERRGLAQKNHGGAIALDLAGMSRQGRAQVLPETKRRLGAAVAAQIPAGATVMLDVGSTTLAVASAMRGPATVITASLDIAQLLAERSGIGLVLLGGQWHARQRWFAGAATLELLRHYRADIAVLGACAVHAQLGLSAGDESDAEVKRCMLKHSRESWLVADHLKLDRCEPYAVGELDQFQRLFIDRAWPALGERRIATYVLDQHPMREHP